MEFGVVLQCNPPAWKVVDLAKRAELAGFRYVWTFDSHLLWQEPYVIYSQILAETHRVVVGPMVTNPATRDWTVTASTFATLNDMFGNLKILVPMAGLIDVAAERARLEKNQHKLSADLARVDSKLATESFVNNAPATVVEKERERQAALRRDLTKLDEQLQQLAAL